MKPVSKLSQGVMAQKRSKKGSKSGHFGPFSVIFGPSGPDPTRLVIPNRYWAGCEYMPRTATGRPMPTPVWHHFWTTF